MRHLPLLTGSLTVVLLGFAGWTVYSAGSTFWGMLLLAAAAFRLAVLARQAWHRLRDRDDDDEQDDDRPPWRR